MALNKVEILRGQHFQSSGLKAGKKKMNCSDGTNRATPKPGNSILKEICVLC